MAWWEPTHWREREGCWLSTKYLFSHYNFDWRWLEAPTSLHTHPKSEWAMIRSLLKWKLWPCQTTFDGPKHIFCKFFLQPLTVITHFPSSSFYRQASIKYLRYKPITAHFNSTRATPGSWLGVAWAICRLLKWYRLVLALSSWIIAG